MTATQIPRKQLKRWTLPTSFPTSAVTKTADVASVPETGGDVTYTFVVTNNGAESVTLTSLSR